MVIKRIRSRLAEAAEAHRKRQAAASAEREQLAAARRAYQEFLGALDWRTAGEAEHRQLAALRDAARLDARSDRQLLDSTFRRMADEALADELLREEEEQRLLGIATALGLTAERLSGDFPDLRDRLIVARANDGRLPVIDPSHSNVVLRAGEQLHAVADAALLKEQAVREWRGGHRGVSFRVAKGVRFYTGSSRGRMVTVGSQLVTADTGELAVTSRRAVFSGRARSLQFDYPKLSSMEVFADGLLIAVSNRQTPSLFRFNGTAGPTVAALINAAIQGLGNGPAPRSRRTARVEPPAAGLLGPEDDR
jgi:hypothetical protein